MTKEIKLIKTNHNGIECYKDETKLYMVTKDLNGKWHLLKAKKYNKSFINELQAWGYEEINTNWTFKTLKDVKMQIEDDILYGIWWDEYQQKLKYNFYEKVSA